MHIEKQYIKGKANVDFIEKQYNYYEIIDTPFMLFGDENKIFENYLVQEKYLFYTEEFYESCLSKVKKEKVVLIKGKQGSGKTTLSLKIANVLKSADIIDNIYYLGSPSEWNLMLQWISTICKRNEQSNNHNRNLWIIDNLHRIGILETDFPDASIFKDDFCICTTRNLNELSYNSYGAISMGISKKQIIMRLIDNKLFFQHIVHLFPQQAISKQQTDRLFDISGGDLSLVTFLQANKKINGLLNGNISDDFMDVVLADVYDFYFKQGKIQKEYLRKSNYEDTIRILNIAQLDYALPLSLQNEACETVLSQYCFTNSYNHIEFEHASLAELLSVSICAKNEWNYEQQFFLSVDWALGNLIEPLLKVKALPNRINSFLQALYRYCFIFYKSSNLYLDNFLVFDEQLRRFIEGNIVYISCDTWNIILNRTSKNDFYFRLFINFAKSDLFAKSLVNCNNYNLSFLETFFPVFEIEVIERNLINEIKILENGLWSSDNGFLELFPALTVGSALEFLEQISVEQMKNYLLNSHDGLHGFSLKMKKISDIVRQKLEDILFSCNFYKEMIEIISLPSYFLLIQFSNEKLRVYLENEIQTKDEIINILINNTIENNWGIRYVGICLENIKRENDVLYQIIEDKIGVDGYIFLIENCGTISDFVRILKAVKASTRQEIVLKFPHNSQRINSLLIKALDQSVGIGILFRTFFEFKRDDYSLLVDFEKILGQDFYITIIKESCALPRLLELINSSSQNMQQFLMEFLQNNPKSFQEIISRTIVDDVSIGTITLTIRNMRKEYGELYETIESMIGAIGYLRLTRSLGNIPLLCNLLACLSLEVQNELLMELEKHPEILKELLEKSIHDKVSIKTFSLYLRELSRNSYDIFCRFEKLLDIEIYLRLLDASGDILDLAKIMQNVSDNIRIKIMDYFIVNPSLIQSLVNRAVSDHKSLGTFALSLRKLKAGEDDIIKTFEKSVGTKGYLALIENLGTIPIMARIFQYSSEEMALKILQELETDNSILDIILKRTIDTKNSIGTLDLALQFYRRSMVGFLERFDALLTVDGYIALFENCNPNAITILRIMACSTLSDDMVYYWKQNYDLWINLKNNIRLTPTLLNNFHQDLWAAEKLKNYNFFNFLEESINIDEWIKWFSYGATIDEFVLIMRQFSQRFAQMVADEIIKNDPEVIVKIYNIKYQRKQYKRLPGVENALLGIKRYNEQLFKLIQDSLEL